ncbi:MAG TPA: hypothetical protein VHL80_01510 [Polyangia bacterium]|nr:hypothetical protein [Polyangia bacterium]
MTRARHLGPAWLVGRTWLVLGLALGAQACTSFQDVSTVVDLRVLAVEADPPDVFLKITGLPIDPTTPPDPTALRIDPASIPTIHLTPLLVDPPAAAAGRAVTWSLSACPNDTLGAAPPGSVMGGGMDPGGGANNTVGSTLCDDARVRLSPIPGQFAAGDTADVQLSPDDLLTAFETDVYRDQYGNFHGGFDLGMPLNLQVTATDGVQMVKAVKRVVFWARTFPDQKLNQIPTIPSVSVFGSRDEATFDLMGPMGTLDPKMPAHAPLDTGLWLLPTFVDGVTGETYRPTIIDRDPPYGAIEGDPTDERIRYAYYATAGHFDPPRTVDQLVPGTTGTIHLESHYVPPATLDGVPVDAATGLHLVDVWIVVRDDRGGESWVTGRIALDPPAP